MAWEPIKTVPKGEVVDVWIVDAGDEIESGVRWTDVKVVGSAPYILALPSRDGEGDSVEVYHPSENGQYLTHWMPRPNAPTP